MPFRSRCRSKRAFWKWSSVTTFALACSGTSKASPEEMVLVEAGDHSIPVFRDVRLPFPTAEFRPGPTFLVDGPYEVFVADGTVIDARRKLGLTTR